MGVTSSSTLPNTIYCSTLQTSTKPTTSFILKTPTNPISFTSSFLPLKCGKVDINDTQDETSLKPIMGVENMNPELLQKMVYDSLVWCSLHGLVVGDKNVKKSGIVPGVGMVHAPFALLPTSFPQSHWQQACELTSIFNELVDRVSLDGKTKKVDDFTRRLLDIHSKMLEINKKEVIRLGLHRSDYMLDDQTKDLLQIELNTISSSFPGLGCLNSIWSFSRNLLNHYGKELGLHPGRVPENAAAAQYAKALAQAWKEYNNYRLALCLNRAVILIVVQTEERNMYDQHWLSSILKERYPFLHSTDNWFLVLFSSCTVHTCRGGQAVAVVYFRAGYAPADYPSESEWRARLLMECSSAVKCPSISYHLAGTKKVQQELAKPSVLERFLENKDDIVKLQKCFAGLWSLDDSKVVKDAIERPQLFVLKPQREGGGNNIYDNNVREALLKLQDGSEEQAAYILMQRIFPITSPMFLVRDGICHQDQAISELGIYGAYLRNKEKVIFNDQCGYLVRTKVSSSNEGGVAAGYGVLDSIYLS
ncbi:hypothetical protein IFM89_000957 [Coptis chinensis]|uniref:Glutathione synthetase n=1 Tax=Coptis chinensis TaxID=261450 RepID=A0A835M6L3_9MAGN|nr:hypothetical protein IFM89_000957 [Coptis chinensis]